MSRARRMTWLAAFLLASCLVGSVPTFAIDAPLGQKPSYITRDLSSVPNEQAIVRRFWAPGLDAGDTPQGLSVTGSLVHMVGYGAGGCRIYSLNPNTGAVIRVVPVPSCKHGGGLAALSDGRLVVADTRALSVMSGSSVSARITLTGALRGSFADFDGRDLWIGSYERDSGGTLWRFPLTVLARPSISEADATSSILIPARAQGMAFGPGGLWVSYSSSTFGRLARVDAATGAELASYDMPAGIEDLGFSSDGLLWAVSEAGAKKYTQWKTNFPLVFAIDVARLR
jgi:hypothetical protein